MRMLLPSMSQKKSRANRNQSPILAIVSMQGDVPSLLNILQHRLVALTHWKDGLAAVQKLKIGNVNIDLSISDKAKKVLVVVDSAQSRETSD